MRRHLLVLLHIVWMLSVVWAFAFALDAPLTTWHKHAA